MHISLIGYGTRGDVQPLIALAKGLQSAGHAVQLVASHDFADWVAAHGVPFAPIGVSVRAMMESEGGVAWVEARNKMQEMAHMRALFAQVGLQSARDMLAAARGSDLVVGGFTSDYAAGSAAEALGIRYMTATLQPLFPTALGEATILPFKRLGASALNRLSGQIAERLLFRVFGEAMAAFRAELGLPPLDRAGYYRRMHATHAVCGFSPTIVPRPRDWPATVHVTGYWFTDEEPGWHPPDELVRFLSDGEAPIYVGFGSMTAADAQGKSDTVMEAVNRSGCRAIVARGWAGLGGGAEHARVHFLKSAPHAWLFPRVAGVVHHGGAGTTAAAFRAGVPQFIVPHFADQPFWARRAHELGVALSPVDQYKLTAGALAGGMRRLHDDAAMRGRAAVLGEHIRAERGVARAVEVIGAVALTPPRRAHG